MRFETKPGRTTARGARIRSARLASRLTLVEAARLLDLPILRLALIENGDVEFERDAAWAEAEEILSRAVERRERAVGEP